MKHELMKRIRNANTIEEVKAAVKEAFLYVSRGLLQY